MSERELRGLPSVQRVLEDPALEEAAAEVDRPYLKEIVRDVLARFRLEIQKGATCPEEARVVERAVQEIRRVRHDGLRPVINATGVLIHTNLGRSPLSPGLVQRAVTAAQGVTDLELHLPTGTRGGRYTTFQRLMTLLTGAESSLLVNNNAAAVMLIVHGLATGKEVIVSRGELIEIGGSFRIPEVIESAGAVLREVGTTNRTHLSDYENAISSRTGLILKVHTSNYKIVGFTHSVEGRELIPLAEKAGVPLCEDLGSGCLRGLTRYGLPEEPTVQEVLASGMPLVTFSGDKLLGGPQAGIVAGRRDWLDVLMKNSMLRALRVDKITMALMERTLQHYLSPEESCEQGLPLYRMLSRSPDDLRSQAEQLCADLEGVVGLSLCVVDSEATMGGGACPGALLPSVAVKVRAEGCSADVLHERLRCGERAVVGRVEEGAVVLDMRTVPPESVVHLAQALRAVFTA